jgi:hypothetical protein
MEEHRCSDGSRDSRCRAKCGTGLEPPPGFWLWKAERKADDGSRTRDLKLGKLALYQLSYVRVEVDSRVGGATTPAGAEIGCMGARRPAVLVGPGPRPRATNLPIPVSVRSSIAVLAVLAVVGLLVYGLASKGSSGLSVGEKAPAARLPLLDGKGEGSLVDYRGRWVLVNVWASWCIPCKQEAPELAAFQK